MNNTVITKREERVKAINYIDEETGEVTTVQAKIPAKSKCVDYGWDKLFLDNFLDVALSVCSSKETVMYYLILNRNADNKINITQKELSAKLSLSIQTVNLAITILKRKNFLKYKNGVYMINPDVIFKGTNEKRMKVLQRYYSFTD